MKFKILLTLSVCLSGSALQLKAQSPASYVNPLIGASTSTAAAGVYHGLGKTFPGADVPFGMVQISPNTITGGDNAPGYSYEHKSIEGFAFTQMSGVGWFGDLGNFLVMPTTGKLYTSAGTLDHPQGGYRSGYIKASEKASAGYYSVKLDNQVKAEMTVAPHSGILKFTFPQNKQSRIQIDLARRVGGTSTLQYVKVINNHTIEGWMKCTPDGGGWGNGDGHADYTVYFHAEFSKPITDYGIWSADIPDDWGRKREDVTSTKYQQRVAQAAVLKGVKEKQGQHLGFYTQFATKAGEQVFMKAGLSFIDVDGARKNLAKEIASWSFDNVHQNAVALWNEALSKVKIDGGTNEEKAVFYTAMYHSMLDPRIIQDVDGRYPGGDGKPHTSQAFNKRTIFSGWDVFRSQMPLQTIINPGLINDEINSLMSLAEEKNKDYFERWELLNAYTGCMLGNPAVSLIADAYAKGIRGYDINKAYRLAAKSVEKFGNGDKGFSGGGLSLSYTLEYAYFDWCAAQLAKAVNNDGGYQKYAARASAYKNVFDKDKGWFRPKNEDGSWAAWPDSGRLKQWYGCMESNPYQQGWFVPHDVDGMVKLMGGNAKVTADLEQFFEKAPQDMMWNDYYNHANEPVHHVPYLFNRVGAPWLTQKWTRAICSRAYHNSVEGLVGNEDVGQMSAWYILSAIGLHPVCPGDTRQEITSPVFDKVTIALDKRYASGTSFTITAENNSPTNIYIQSAQLNGKPYNKCFIDYKDIMAGGTLKLIMGANPSKNWGVTN
ncbi:GH92 family glycosyl hydrolase [Mucilaginibacter litoreus]|uniref:GH92 family glycosyl hydrolase n=1 Tax=Mucilaginibacter litoreus TaxID=1048221 RepID=A0ABW3ARW5_9SPHI